jgi:5-methylcytosine-specific restriction endonuclease McrA
MENRRNARKRQHRINVKLKKKFGDVLYSCHYCKLYYLMQDLTIEHLVPLTLGGTNEMDNIALACLQSKEGQRNLGTETKEVAGGSKKRANKIDHRRLTPIRDVFKLEV